MDNLLSLIKDDLISNPTSKIIIFAKNKFSCTNINQFLQHNKLKSAIYNNGNYGDLSWLLFYLL